MPELALQPQQEVSDKSDIVTNVPVRPEGMSALNFHRETRTITDPNTKKTRKVPGRLSRRGMMQAIAAGYHVQIPTIQSDGTAGMRMVTRKEDLPNDAELAEAFGEDANVDELQNTNKQRIEQLKSENDRLEALRARQQQQQQRTAPNVKGNGKENDKK
jgi:hypothetical protein